MERPILCFLEDVLDVQNIGRPALSLADMGRRVVLVLTGGSPADKAISAGRGGIPKALQGLERVRPDGAFSRGEPHAVLSTMVRTDATDGFIETVHRQSTPLVLVQDRGGWWLHKWQMPPTAICVLDEHAKSLVLAHEPWKGAGVECSVTGTGEFDQLFEESQEVNVSALREEIKLPEGGILVHLAADKGHGVARQQAMQWLEGCTALHDEEGAFILPSVHPAASEEDKAAFREIFKGRERVIQPAWNPTERVMAAHVTIASIVSGMPSQASALGRIGVGYAGRAECEALAFYLGTDDPGGHPFVQSKAIFMAQSPEELAHVLAGALSGDRLVEHLPNPKGDAAANVADCVLGIIEET